MPPALSSSSVQETSFLQPSEELVTSHTNYQLKKLRPRRCIKSGCTFTTQICDVMNNHVSTVHPKINYISELRNETIVENSLWAKTLNWYRMTSNSTATDVLATPVFPLLAKASLSLCNEILNSVVKISYFKMCCPFCTIMINKRCYKNHVKRKHLKIVKNSINLQNKPNSNSIFYQIRGTDEFFFGNL